MGKLFKFVGIGNEASFAVDFNDGAKTIIVDVGRNDTFASFAVTTFFGFCKAFFTHGFEGLIKVAVGFDKSFFSIS